MFDFTITHPSKIASFFCCLLYFVIVFSNWQKIRYSKTTKASYWPILLGVILYSVTQWVPGDWFHYQEWINIHTFSHEDQEAPYLFLRVFLNHNYLLFRIIVWGSAAFLLSLVFKVMKLDVKSSLFVFFSIYAMMFSYGRVSLGMSFFFLGYCIIIQVGNSNHKILQAIGGVVLMLLSTFFHRTMFVLVLLSLVTIIPIKKKMIIFYILFAIVFFYMSSLYLKGFLYSDFLTDSDLSWKLERANNEVNRTEGANFNGMVLYMLKYATIYVPIICSSIALFRKETRKKITVQVYSLYILTLFILAYALAMYVALPNDIFFSRTLYMCMMPSCIVMSYMYQKKLLKKYEWMLSLFTGIFYNGLVLINFSI